jgi:penicillin amidase
MMLGVNRWDNSWAMNYPGQSGDLESPSYRDFTQMCLTGKYFPLLFSRSAVEKVTEIRIQLVPARERAVCRGEGYEKPLTF